VTVRAVGVAWEPVAERHGDEGNLN